MDLVPLLCVVRATEMPLLFLILGLLLAVFMVSAVSAIILVDVSGLELLWPDNLPERWSQSTKIAPF
jgi:hypothetical protein